MAVQKQTKPTATAATKAPTKAPSKTPPPPAGDDEGGEDQSLADIFDNVKQQGKVDEGKHDAIIREFVLQPFKEGDGQSVRSKYHIISGECAGQEITQFYKIILADRTPGPGAGYLKQHLAMLGHTDVTYGDMEEVFEEIVNNEQLGVLITVKQNGQFTNAYLNGIMPDPQEVIDYRAENPF